MNKYLHSSFAAILGVNLRRNSKNIETILCNRILNPNIRRSCFNSKPFNDFKKNLEYNTQRPTAISQGSQTSNHRINGGQTDVDRHFGSVPDFYKGSSVFITGGTGKKFVKSQKPSAEKIKRIRKNLKQST